jgi:DNA-binding NarL/FixJ family response regulator
VTEAGTVRVMLVDDHADFRSLVAVWVDQQPDLAVVAQVGSLEEARRQAASVGYDVAVLDMGLPDGVGSDLIAELRELRPGCAVMILSASLDEANLARAREAGVDEIMDKFVDPAKVVGAIRRVGNG